MDGKNTAGKIIVIGGPTGIGKSAVAFGVARETAGEIISADSMQFYRELNIGTDKVPESVRKLVPHHMMDFLSLKDSFDAYTFSRMACERAERVISGGKVPVIAGGSGLYLRSLVKGLFTVPGVDRETQREIRLSLEGKSTEELYLSLLEADPVLKTTVHPNDRKRISRALEIFLLTGRPFSHWQKCRPESALGDKFRINYFILLRDRTEMYERIDNRVERMFGAGWVEEVKMLKDSGYAPYLRGKAPIGYVEILQYLDGVCGLDELKAEIKRKTRNFAKKQLTWFRKEEGIPVLLSGNGEDAVAEIVRYFYSM